MARTAWIWAVALVGAPATFPSEDGLVHVEVVVTDGRHSPVTGLPAEAFHLAEGGERQRLESFQAVDLPEPTAREPATSGPPRVSTNAAGADAAPPRTFVVVFDDVHLAPAGAREAREVVERFVARHTLPADQVILVAPGEDLVWPVAIPGGRASLSVLVKALRGRREATSPLTDYESFRIVANGDAALEERVLERIRDAAIPASQDVVPAESGAPARSVEDPGRGQVESVRSEARQVLETARRRRRRLLSALAAALRDLPATRTLKSVFLVSEGFIYEPRDPLTYDVIAVSQRAGAVIHFLDVRGLAVGSRPDEARRRTTAERSVSRLRGESTGAEILATITGGHVVRNATDLADTLGRLSREASHYYILGYRPAGERRAGRLRKIHVEVDRPDVVVRARKGYWDAPDTGRDSEHDTPALDAPLREALRSPSPVPQIPLRLTTLALAPADDGRVQVTVASEASARALTVERMPDGSLGTTLDVVLEIRHVQPRASQVLFVEGLAARVPGGAPADEAWLPVRRRFTLPPGPCQVKLVVRDRGSGAIGTVVHDLEVPDAAGFLISSPILSDMLEGEGAERPRVVARRSFAAGGVLYCYFEVHPGAAIPAPEPAGAVAAYEIVDGRGTVRQRAALPPPVRREEGRLARLLEIPLAGLEPGEYELVVNLEGTETARLVLREPFSVRRPRRFDDDLYRGALHACLAGDLQRAVATLLQWPATEVRAAAERLAGTAEPLREAALVLHTDLAMVLRRHGLHSDAETHLAIGRALLQTAHRPDLRREWLLALASAHQASSRPAEALAFYTECAQAFPERGEARLGAGTIYERHAFPDGLQLGNLSLPPREAAREAERWYRDALRVQPSLSEARLRLARVLQRTNRVDEALPQLSLVVESGEDDSLRALAHLFWGEICEARGDVGGAVEHYRGALAADRHLQVAGLALAQILHRRHGRRAAVDALVPALGAGGGPSPWLAYRRGPLGLSASPLSELRSRLHVATGDAR